MGWGRARGRVPLMPFKEKFLLTNQEKRGKDKKEMEDKRKKIVQERRKIKME